MTTRPDMHVFDWGTAFIMQVMSRRRNKPLPLGDMDWFYIKFQPPGMDEEPFSRPAAILTMPDGTDGKIYYIFAEGDVHVIGKWRAQGFVGNEDGEWHTDIEEFEVGENIVVSEEAS